MVVAQSGDKKNKKREPECPNLRAWSRTYRDLLGAKDVSSRSALLDILTDYLVAVPGTPIVERWLGDVKMLELKHRAHKLSGASVANCLKLLKQDMNGRRPAGHILEPKSLLVKNSGHLTSQGVRVVLPASRFLLDSQRLFREFYGGKSLSCRDLTPLSAAQQSAQRHLSEKPALGVLRKRGDDSVAAATHKHSESVQAGIQALAAGARAGVIGQIVDPPPESARSSRDVMIAAVKQATANRQVAAPDADGVVKKRKKEDAVSRKDERVTKQARIGDVKLQAHSAAPPGCMPRYVGPRGETWQRGSSVPLALGPAESSLPLIKKVWFGMGAPADDAFRAGVLTGFKAVLCKKASHADMIVVDSVSGRWASLDAFHARLWGRTMVDVEYARSHGTAGTHARFLSAQSRCTKTVYMTADFQKSHPDFAKALIKVGLEGPIKVISGSMPPDTKNCLEAVSAAELAALPRPSSHKCGLSELMNRLSFAA